MEDNQKLWALWQEGCVVRRARDINALRSDSVTATLRDTRTRRPEAPTAHTNCLTTLRTSLERILADIAQLNSDYDARFKRKGH